MLYCPFCERPVRALVGSCPHCRRAFEEAGSAPTALRSIGTDATMRAPAPAAPSGMESPVDAPEVALAFDPRAARVVAPVRAPLPSAGLAAPVPPEGELDPAEVERVAGVRRPRRPLEMPLYAWRAIRRLPALRTAAAAAALEAERAAAANLDALAAWGREHAREVANLEEMRPAIESAMKARADLDGFRVSHVADLARFRDDDAALEKEAAEAAARKVSLDARAAALEGELHRREEALERLHARVRRAEIEIRNLERLAGGQIAPGSPHAARRAEMEEAHARAAADAASAEGEAAHIRTEAGRLRAEIADLDAGVAARRSAIASDPVRRRVWAEKQRHEDALRAGAARIASQALERGLIPADSEAARHLRALGAAAESAGRAKLLHDAALASIDRSLIARGAVMAGAAASLVVLLLVMARLAC